MCRGMRVHCRPAETVHEHPATKGIPDDRCFARRESLASDLATELHGYGNSDGPRQRPTGCQPQRE